MTIKKKRQDNARENNKAEQNGCMRSKMSEKNDNCQRGALHETRMPTEWPKFSTKQEQFCNYYVTLHNQPTGRTVQNQQLFNHEEKNITYHRTLGDNNELRGSRPMGIMVVPPNRQKLGKVLHLAPLRIPVERELERDRLLFYTAHGGIQVHVVAQMRPVVRLLP